MSTNRLQWDCPLRELYAHKIPKSVDALAEAGYKTVGELIWLIPSRYEKIPHLASFKQAVIGEAFCGAGKIVSFRVHPNFYAKGRRKVLLQNITLVVKDYFDQGMMELKWFNTYPSVAKKLKNLDFVTFSGRCKLFQGKRQIINPDTLAVNPDELEQEVQAEKKFAVRYKIQYPTVNGVNSANIKRVIDKIPDFLWDDIQECLPQEILEKGQMSSISLAFKVVHGKLPYSKQALRAAKSRLIYEEFFQEQVKLLSRRKNMECQEGIKIGFSPKLLSEAKNLFPYRLTADQECAIDEIASEMDSGYPMMRLVQGDVGCGKTSVAVATLYLSAKAGHQGALMCPTESLAMQHFGNIKEVLMSAGLCVELLLGSTRTKEKRKIRERLELGDIDVLIGTHALIQQSVVFYSLGVTVIDEQHKFGVNQRLQLATKNQGGHCLIMTATPIPRSLSLTRYGDLSLSVIKSMPAGRKGTRTRIIPPEKFGPFLNFVHTRLEMGEQAYVVVPAIKESENLDIANLEKVHHRFEKLFPTKTVRSLHGQMRADEKEQAFGDFKEKNIDILIATSVIEVGINVVNATIMAVLNPERFGLSSLHQLRGRVGRGSKPGFFFLVNDKKLSLTAHDRLKILEQTTDGFRISEEDLKLRGQGDLLGVQQSGSEVQKRLANIVEHQAHLLNARQDVGTLLACRHPYILNLMDSYKYDSAVMKTI